MLPVDPPRFELVEKPSPLQRLPRFSEALGGRVDVWIKREDLLPLAFGGNKIRNLEYLVGAALAEGADTLVTSGRRWSNHCRLTAAAGARAGLGVHLVVSGPPADRPGPGVRVAELLGATVHELETPDREERDTTVERLVTDLRVAGRRPYVIGVGGSGLPGTLGQLDGAYELIGQLDELDSVVPNAVFLPSATGGTQTGLVVANRQTAGIAATIVGVLVARTDAELRPSIEAQIAELASLIGMPGVPAGDIVLDGTQLGEGYGRPTDAATDAARLLARTEGILVDPIYTAKALAALVARARTGELDGETVIFWHAGGTPGLFEPLD